jgi:ABC-type histidine transport system ATPase subunit
MDMYAFRTLRGQPLRLALTVGGGRKSERAEKTRALFRDLGIGSLARRFPRTMSQGEKQRVAIARALANDPALVLADEPTGSLETRQGFDIIRLLHGAGQSAKCGPDRGQPRPPPQGIRGPDAAPPGRDADRRLTARLYFLNL